MGLGFNHQFLGGPKQALWPPSIKKIGGALLWLMLESLSLGCNSLFWLAGLMWGVVVFQGSINQHRTSAFPIRYFQS
jgi:hypothetical protein